MLPIFTGTTTSISPTTSGGCQHPDWANDLYCDDGNNNAGCNYDGGACCPGSNPWDGWDKYCSVCECLEGMKIVDKQARDEPTC